MKNMATWIAVIAIFLLKIGYGETKQEEGIRIFQLLPLLEHPPLVNPCLPSGFTLGIKENDPTFETGYYWGYPTGLKEYFSDYSKLNSCVIQAKLSNEITQVGLDRFSHDKDIVHRLTASGLSEIKIVRGKWGIFPFRELQAKGAKGKRCYELWVGLNGENGETLHFQLIYPEYLNGPTQSQKQIWHNFVQKTKLLDLPCLLTAQEIAGKLQKQKKESFDYALDLKVEKLNSDRIFFIRAEKYPLQKGSLNIRALKEMNSFMGMLYGKPCVEIDYSIQLSNGKILYDTVRMGYELVDQFSFIPEMLSRDYWRDNCWAIYHLAFPI